MTGRLQIQERHRVKLGRGIQMRFDKARNGWALMAPERILVLDDISHEVLTECIDSSNDIGTVIEILANRFNAPREEIAGDVMEMLQGFVDKKMVVCDD